jgi:hypothetical protein
MVMQIKSLLVFLVIVHAGLFAQELVTDRPDQTESAVTVPRNSLQIEAGILYENFNDSELHSVPGTLFRYGLFEKIELRLGAGYLVHKTHVTNNGIGDFLIGAKINFLTEDRSFADVGLMVHAFLPVGSEAFRPQETEPEIIAAFSKTISEKISFSSNFGGSLDSSIDEIIYLYTAALGYSFTNKLGVYIEVFGNFSSSAPLHYFDGGFTWLLTDNIQLDFSGGKNFSGSDSHWFIGSGVSLRLTDL